ncbi:MAG: hypothetical protein R3200_13665, partial [Xanthomonadales bacterium]|nr:hypothetical protein [Xanthomonadales bacterium]
MSLAHDLAGDQRRRQEQGEQAEDETHRRTFAHRVEGHGRPWSGIGDARKRGVACTGPGATAAPANNPLSRPLTMQTLPAPRSFPISLRALFLCLLALAPLAGAEQPLAVHEDKEVRVELRLEQRDGA